MGRMKTLASNQNQNQKCFTSQEVLGQVRFATKGLNEISVKCNAFAAQDDSFSDNKLKVIAFAGPSSTVKAAIAMLYSKSACTVHAESIPGFSRYYKGIKQRDTKWQVHKTQLGEPRYRLWHAIAWEKSDPRLMLDCSEDSLWSVLRSDKFTTPILKRWLPWIRERLLTERHLRTLTSWGCSPGILQASDLVLDRIVSNGVISGELSFTTSRHRRVSA